MRIAFILFCAVVALIAAPYTQPYVENNGDLVVIIITVFSVFAGFLVAVITVVGDPALIPEGSWRSAELRRDTIESRLLTHVYLFLLYLLTIALLFIGVVAQKALANHEIIKIWIERLYLFFGVFSFLLTFGLPIALMRLQRTRVSAEIERRRARDGIPAETTTDAS